MNRKDLESYVIKKIDSTSNTVTVDGNANETIDGQLTVTLDELYQFITIHCDGTRWFVIGR